MRVKLLALLSAATLFVLAAVPASAASQGIGYLAFGDSVPFGYSPLLNPTVASNFVGYPEIAARLLNIQDVNATCPGEATGGFISLRAPTTCAVHIGPRCHFTCPTPLPSSTSP